MHWGVAVYHNEEQILFIGPSSLSGKELTQEDEEAIRVAGEQLLAFVGRREEIKHEP